MEQKWKIHVVKNVVRFKLKMYSCEEAVESSAVFEGIARVVEDVSAGKCKTDG